MPEYNSKVSYGIQRGGKYQIISAEEIVTRNNLVGVRVTMRSRDINDHREYGETLWPAEQTSASSKWGCFVAALQSNTDTWVNKWIEVISWQAKLCEIKLIPAPAAKTALGKKAEKMGGEVTT